MQNIRKALSVIEVPLTGLKAYAYNARTHSKHQIREIADSIGAFGFTNPVLINQDSTIIAGNGRVAAAALLGMDRVPTIRIEHLSSDQIRAYVLAEHKFAENAGWDKEILAIELQNLIRSSEIPDPPLKGSEVPETDDPRVQPDHEPSGRTESPAFSDFREKHDRFYRKLAILTERRTQDRFVFETAMGLLHSEQIRQIPVKCRHSYEGAVWEAQKIKLLSERRARPKSRARALATFSSKGGRAKRSNPINELIDTFVHENPAIGQHDVRVSLNKKKGGGVVHSVSRQTVRYFDNDVLKELSQSALTNRLYRAKKKAKNIRVNRLTRMLYP